MSCIYYLPFLVLVSWIRLPLGTLLIKTFCFSRQSKERMISAGITTEKDSDLPTRVIFLIEFVGLIFAQYLTQ